MNRTLATGVAAVCLAARFAVAQSDDSSSSHKTFFTPRDGAIGAAALLASAGLSIFDARIAHWFSDTSLTHVREGHKLDNFFTHVNETTLTVGGLIVYGVAKVAKANTVADIAFHAAESVAAASLTAQVIRGPLGRTQTTRHGPAEREPVRLSFLQGLHAFSAARLSVDPLLVRFRGRVGIGGRDEDARPERGLVRRCPSVRARPHPRPVAHVPRPALGDRHSFRRISRDVLRLAHRGLLARTSDARRWTESSSAP